MKVQTFFLKIVAIKTNTKFVQIVPLMFQMNLSQKKYTGNP